MEQQQRYLFNEIYIFLYFYSFFVALENLIHNRWGLIKMNCEIKKKKEEELNDNPTNMSVMCFNK